MKPKLIALLLAAFYLLFGCGNPIVRDLTDHMFNKDGFQFTHNIGDIGPGGGIIFYRNAAGFTVQGYGTPGVGNGFASYTAHYLEAAPADIAGTSAWGLNSGTPNMSSADVPLAKQDGIGYGRKNTQEILAIASPPSNAPAAHECNIYSSNGKSDWFLPSKDELNQLYVNRSYVPGLIITSSYWSSSQQSASGTTSVQNFIDGSPSTPAKWGTNYVRSIRAF